MKDIDEELSLQIKIAFEDLDDGRSEMGWAMLLEKYEKPYRRLPIWWVTGIAASLAIVAGLWLFLSNPAQKVSKPIETVEQNNATIIKDNNNLQQTKTENKVLDSNLDLSHPKLEKEINKVEKAEKNNLSTTKTELKTTDQPQPQLTKNDAIKLEKAEKTNLSTIKTELKTTDQPQPQLTKNEATKLEKGEKPEIKTTDYTNVVQKPVQIVSTPNLSNPVNPITTEEFLKEQSKIAATKAEAKVKEKKTKVRNNSYEIFTGTFLNYFGDNDVKVNAGFGLNANLKVSKNLFLSVGAGISQNNIAYQSYTPNQQKGLLYDAAPSYSTNTGGSAVTNTLQAGYISNTKLNAQLLSLDLPITLKFYPTKKQNFYFSTGFNSNSYFAQKYDYTYTLNSSSSFSSSAQSELEKTEKSKFKGFDLANSAIFAIGINQKFGKTNSLTFEPYFKPAIRDMGDKNLRINTVGLNLKLNFGNTNKK
jgi:hypothetical protein